MSGKQIVGKNRVVLFFPDPLLPDTTWHRTPFSVISISGLLLENNVEVMIFDERVEQGIQKKVLSSLDRAICFGISAFTGSQIKGGLDIAKVVKESYPDLPIVWGGWHPSIFPEQTLENPYVDIVVYGQGERTFAELVERLKQGSSLDGLLGTAFKVDGNLVKNPARPLEDINNFPPYTFNLVNLENYVGIHPVSKLRTMSYLSTQGCPYACGFCVDKMVYNRRWFGLKSERVIQEVTFLVKTYNLEGIYCEDNNFLVDKKRVEEICRGFIKNKLGIKWDTLGHPRQLAKFDDDFYELLKESGCSRILTGAESGEQAILDLVHKDSTVQDTIEFVKKAKRHGISPILSTMAGFPMSPRRDLHMTIKLALKLKRFYPETEFKLFLYTPYPGTDLYEMALKNGMKEPKSLLEWSKHTLRDVKTPWLDDRYRRLIRDVAFFYFQLAYPSQATREKIKEKRFAILVKFVFRIFQRLARIRLSFNFYSFPIEITLYKLTRGIIDKTSE
ncbi:MAG: radical SAM protein [Candidatus Omnitrophota bacterium]